MTDSWEDWENEDYTIPVLNAPNPEELKRLEERKLVEESDLQNARDLFSNEEEDLALQDVKNQEIKKNKTISVKQILKREKKVSNQKINEQKQKEQSKILKEEKAKKAKAKELYGEADDENKYADYEDMFY
jgi:hypothetical protein